MTDEEVLGAITLPARFVPVSRRRGIRRVLERHPLAGDMVRPCERCGRPAFGYHHPNPLRPGVVLWRCPRHRFPGQIVDDPKAAPGGGVYR